MRAENSNKEHSRLEEQLKILCEANQQLNTRRSIKSICTILVQFGQKLVNARAGAVGLFKDNKMLFNEYYLSEDATAINYAFESGVGVPGWVTDHLEPYITNDAAQDPQVLSEIQQALGFTNLINVPIVDHANNLIGCLEIHNKRDNMQFNQQDIEMLQGLAASAANAMSNAIFLKQLEDQQVELIIAKERYRNLIESTSDWAWEVDCAGAYTYVSPKIQSILGYSQIEVIGRTPFDLMPQAEAERVQHIFVNQFLNEEKPIQRLVNINLHKNGHEVILETSAIPIYDTAGCFAGYRGIDRDVTDRVNTELTLSNEKEKAENANIAKSKFIFRMSHELRTPLNAILGFGQILEMNADDLNETQNSNINEILDAGYHLLKLIDDVLDLAKIESGKLEIHMETVEVSEVLQQCTHLITPQLNDSHIEFIDNVTAKGHIVQADPTRLKQALLNLLTNAIKYNCCQGRVFLTSDITDSQMLRITVKDTGAGIAEDELKKLFVPYERLHATINIEGTGIGLNITKHLIELMGGRIGVESVLGEGSSFWIELSLV